MEFTNGMLLYIFVMISDKKIKSSLFNTEKHNLMKMLKLDLNCVSLIMLKIFCERAEIGKQTGLKILRVVTPLWVQVPPLAPKKIVMKLLILFLTIILEGKATFSENIDKDIEKFILNNPEVILKSLENYEIQKGKRGKRKNKEKVRNTKKFNL